MKGNPGKCHLILSANVKTILTIHIGNNYRNNCICKNPANIYLLKVNNRNTGKRCEIGSKVTKNTRERRPIFPGKYLRWSLFLIKLQAFRPETIIKRLQHRYLPVNIGRRSGVFIVLEYYLSIDGIYDSKY